MLGTIAVALTAPLGCHAYPRDSHLYAGNQDVQNVFSSSNGKFVLRVDTKEDELMVEEGWLRTVKWRIHWPQDAPPRYAFVSDDGDRIILFDTVPVASCFPPFTEATRVALVTLDGSGQALNTYAANDPGLQKAIETAALIDPSLRTKRLLDF